MFEDFFQKKTVVILLIFTLSFCLLVILWGAWVRISHSGDGCGSTWPACSSYEEELIEEKKGIFFSFSKATPPLVVPPLRETSLLVNKKEAEKKAFIEWFHRLSSMAFGIWIFLFFVLSVVFSLSIKKSLWVTFLLTLSEGLIGACLVLVGLTGSNASFLRALVLALHLMNSIFLVGSITLCLKQALVGNRVRLKNIFRGKNGVFVSSFLILALFGSFASLSSTLFPSLSLWEGLKADFESHSHIFLKLRGFHPFLAICLVLLMCIYQKPKGHFFKFLKGAFFVWKQKRNLLLKNHLFFFGITFLTGVLNLFFLSPVFLKLLHLLMFYVTEIIFLLYIDDR